MKKKKDKTKTIQTGVTVNVNATTSVEEEKETFNWGRVILILILMFLSAWGGFFKGKNSIVPLPPIYIPGDTVRVEMPYPVPIEVNKPCDSLDIIKACVASGKYEEFFPKNIIETIKYVPTREDTVNTILNDWATERIYEEKILDVDTLGSATVRAKVQYNRILDMSAEVVPAIKEVRYIIPPRKFVPAIGVGMDTKPDISMDFGGFIQDKYGLFFEYQRDMYFKKNVFGINVMYKF